MGVVSSDWNEIQASAVSPGIYEENARRVLEGYDWLLCYSESFLFTIHAAQLFPKLFQHYKVT